jgi:signal transduction histidine kinase
MRSRLYRQIYLAFIAVVAVSILVAMIAARALWERDAELSPQIAAAAQLVVRDLPRGPGLPAALRARAAELSADLTLWSPDGTRLASSTERHEPPRLDGGSLQPFHRRQRGGAHVQLGDGRWLTLSMRHDHERGRGLSFFVVGILLVGTMALATFPIARRITRRLERLRSAVERFGQGELKARVPVHGRDEIAQVARAFNRAADRIDTLVEQHKRVLASASHELRAPLARLRMALELLLDTPEALSEDRRQQLLAQCGEDIAELDALVGDVLLAARLERSDVAREFAPVDLGALVAREAERAGASLVGGEPLHGDGDERMLRRMLLNLLDNARKHGGGSPVEVRLERRAQGARIVVSDRGPGVPEAERERIFEPFYRPAGHREGRDGGVGLGLSLVRQIAEHHGGAARCVAGAGGGSRFEIDLPGFT